MQRERWARNKQNQRARAVEAKRKAAEQVMAKPAGKKIKFDD